MKGKPHPAWKKMERAFARWLGYDREPRSGGDRARGRTDRTGSDSTHPRLWIDCKHTGAATKTQPQVVTRYMEVRDKARKEGKTPVLVTKGMRMKGNIISVHQDDLLTVAHERARAIYLKGIEWKNKPRYIVMARWISSIEGDKVNFDETRKPCKTKDQVMGAVSLLLREIKPYQISITDTQEKPKDGDGHE